MPQHQSPNAADPERSSVATAMELLHLLRLSMANALTSQQYQVFALHFLEGMPQKEIADELGLSRSGVSKCYHAAVASLWAYWKPEDRRELKHKILDYLEDLLTDKQYQVFVRHFMHGRQEKGIATEDGVSRSAVCKTYAAAMHQLRKLWNT